MQRRAAARQLSITAMDAPGARDGRSCMELWTAIQALILGIVEGLTEFLPISSTGHQIIVADLSGFGGDRAKAFNVIIQLGAILAVVWEFRQRILGVVVGLPRE